MSTGRRERKKLELRERIIDVATALIAEQGLSSVTVDKIAEACDIAQATFFNYFASKGALLDALIERLVVSFNRVLEAMGDTDASTTGMIGLLFQATVALTPDEQRVVQDIIGESLRTRDQRTVDTMSRARDLFVADLAERQARGRTRADRSAAGLADAVFGLYYAAMLFADPGDDRTLTSRLHDAARSAADLLAVPHTSAAHAPVAAADGDR